MSAAVATHMLVKRFRWVQALSGLTLEVPEGAIYALLGPNGAGKTTTLQILLNLLRPSDGSAEVLGVDSRRLKPEDRERIGYVSENQKLLEWMTLDQLIAYCRPFYPSWDDALADHLVRMLDLPRDRKLRGFSRGMKMKAAMVISLAYRPKLLLLDEPFSGLDPVVRDQMIEALVEISASEGMTTLVSSHDIGEIENVADHVGFLHHGRLTVSERLEELLARFREVEAIVPEGVAVAVPRDSWLRAQQKGGVYRFVESRYQPERSEEDWAAALPGATSIEASPMSLRQVFVALARGREAEA